MRYSTEYLNRSSTPQSTSLNNNRLVKVTTHRLVIITTLNPIQPER